MQHHWQRAPALWPSLGRAADASVSLELPGPPQAKHPLLQEGSVTTSPPGAAGPPPAPTALGMSCLLSTSWVPEFKILF